MLNNKVLCTVSRHTGEQRWYISRGRYTVTYARHLVEKRLKKRLSSKIIVHHADNNPLNDDPSNLVVCENQGYHKLLHLRTDALRVTGSVHARRCNYCGRWGIPGEDMILYSPDKRSLNSLSRAKCRSCTENRKKKRIWRR